MDHFNYSNIPFSSLIERFSCLQLKENHFETFMLLEYKKRATRCTKAPAYAESGKGSHHLVYCTQPYPVFTQEAVSGT